MKRMTWLAVVCLLGGLMVATVVSKLREPARAAEMATPSASALDVVINEVAWMGTAANYADEWIELYNTTDHSITLTGWTISDDGDISITLNGVIPAGGYFLLERSDDNTVLDIPADQIYTGNLNNDGEVLILRDDMGQTVDTANGNGGAWPAGDNNTKHTMEHIDPTAPDSDANWCANDGITCNGLDADGDPINGTPTAQNSCYQPPTGPIADLSVAKSGPATVGAGDLITYHVTLSNTGATTATGTLLTDTLPAAVDFVTQTSLFTFTGLGRDLVWQLGDVPTGTQYLITITGRVTGTASGILTNLVTATTTASETVLTNNHDTWETKVEAGPTVYLPLVFRNYTPPPYWVIVEAVLYDGLQYNDPDEAVLLLNGGDGDVDLTGWELCKWGTTDWRCADLPAVIIAPHQRLWLARSGTSFAASFGFEPDHVLSGWPAFANSGDEVVLRDAEGFVRDALVYEAGDRTINGWSGPAVQPYGGSNFASEGQVLYRFPDEETGLPPRLSGISQGKATYGGTPIKQIGDNLRGRGKGVGIEL